MPGKNKMIVVDDDMITRNIAKLIFQDNFEVLEAENGQVALELLNRFRQDIVFILCDVSMPVMDGFTFLKKKNEYIYNNGIPVIIITAVGDDQIRQQAISLGAADFVDKPLNPKVVSLRVNNVLSNYGIGYAYNDALQREFLDLINRQLRGGILSIYDEKDYPIHYISESLAVYLGYDNAAELVECLDGRWSNMLSPEEFIKDEKIVKTQLAEKEEFIHEYRLRKKDGSHIWVRENGKYSGDSGTRKKIVALCVDITDTKNAEEKALYNEQLARIAMESTSISIWEYDFESKCIIQGQNAIEVHGFEIVVPNIPESLIDSQYVHPDSAAEFKKMYDDLRNGAKKAEGVFKVRTADRKGYWYEHIHYTNTFGKDGRPYRAIGISSDVTEQKMIIAQYQREMDFNKALSPDIFATARINISQEIIEEVHTDIEEDQKLINNITFQDLPQVMTQRPYISKDTSGYFTSLKKESITEAYNCGRRTITYEFLKEINGKPVWVSFELHMMKDPHTDDLLVFAYFRNIDKQHREVERLKELAERDQMTGLYNHDTTIDLIKRYLSVEGAKQIHALFIVDVNKFKSINDRYGHMQGDNVLIEVAKRIQSVFRIEDVVGRVGGDEFMILIKNISSYQLAERKAVELADATHFVFRDGNVNIDVSCSIGVTLYTGRGTDFDELYKKADDAMYEAKQAGGCRYVITEI